MARAESAPHSSYSCRARLPPTNLPSTHRRSTTRVRAPRWYTQPAACASGRFQGGSVGMLLAEIPLPRVTSRGEFHWRIARATVAFWRKPTRRVPMPREGRAGRLSVHRSGNHASPKKNKAQERTESLVHVVYLRSGLDWADKGTTPKPLPARGYTASWRVVN